MSLRSVYVSEPSFENDRIRIQGEEHRHLVVARAEKDELIEIFDGKGNVWTASVESAGKRETVAALKESRQVTRDSMEVILALALIRIPAFELALEKVVEVGVTRIVPFAAARSMQISAGGVIDGFASSSKPRSNRNGIICQPSTRRIRSRGFSPFLPPQRLCLPNAPAV